MENKKKILIFSHPEQDHLSYQIHHGFCDLIGGDNVITYPFKKSHHGLIADDYILDDGKTGYTAPEQYMVALQGIPYTSQMIKDVIRFGQIRFAIIESPRTYALKAAREFKDLLQQYNVPLIFVDGEDSTHIRKDIIEEFNINIHFKRELLIDVPNKNNLSSGCLNIYPLPFSCILNNNNDFEQKDIDVFFGVGMTHSRRRQLLNILKNSIELKKYNVCAYSDQDTGKLSFEDYVNKMGRSKMNIICRGHGWDTVRRFEACAFTGMMLSDKIPLQMPYEFIDKMHLVYYEDNFNDLISKILYYLHNDKERKLIGVTGNEYATKHHTSVKRAQYMIDLVEQTVT